MEEYLCRGFVPAYLKERGHIIIIAVGGICFIFHHAGNMTMYGFSAIFCLNVFLAGAIMYLLIQISGNFWIVCGFHSAWNYTQQYLFGIPNSGSASQNHIKEGLWDAFNMGSAGKAPNRLFILLFYIYLYQ